MGNQYELVGRHALVTGGRGIGQAIAELLAANGARVLVHAYSREEAEQACAAIKGVPSWGDLADPAVREALAETARVAFGSQLDILVHNAGIYPQETMESETLEGYRQVMAVNVEAQWHLTKLLLPMLKASGQASVVLISSVVTRLGRGDSPAYTTSKSAQIGLARHLAGELGPHGVRANAVLPGQIDTPGARAVNADDEHFRRFAREQQMVEVPLRGEDIAHATAFLCSTAARGITAASLDVNGGLRVGG